MPPARNERVKFNVDFLSVSINQSNGLLKTVRLPVLFGSLVIFPSKDGQITSSRVLFAMKEFIRRYDATGIEVTDVYADLARKRLEAELNAA